MVHEFQHEFVVNISQTIAGITASTMLPPKVVISLFSYLLQNPLEQLERVRKILPGALCIVI